MLAHLPCTPFLPVRHSSTPLPPLPFITRCGAPFARRYLQGNSFSGTIPQELQHILVYGMEFVASRQQAHTCARFPTRARVAPAVSRARGPRRHNPCHLCRSRHHRSRSRHHPRGHCSSSPCPTGRAATASFWWIRKTRDPTMVEVQPWHDATCHTSMVRTCQLAHLFLFPVRAVYSIATWAAPSMGST